MALSATRLRQRLYQILDQVLETGTPVEIERRGKILRISTKEPVSKLERLTARRITVGDPEELVHNDWSSAWRGLGGER